MKLSAWKISKTNNPELRSFNPFRDLSWPSVPSNYISTVIDSMFSTTSGQCHVIDLKHNRETNN